MENKDKGPVFFYRTVPAWIEGDVIYFRKLQSPINAVEEYIF